jgi:hypothetical protein
MKEVMEPDDDLFTFDSAIERREMRRRHASMGRRMQLVASYAVEELERKMAAGEPLNLSREEAEKLKAVGEELERKATRGEPGPTKPN